MAGKPGVDAEHPVSRQHKGSGGTTAITTPLEERQIILAQGLQYLNHELPNEYKGGHLTFKTPEYLEKRGLVLDHRPDGSSVYTSKAQRVRYVIRKITTKTEFKDALETAGAHVIYGGHARYGRGPCFGDNMQDFEQWEVGSKPAVNGIFRWGYPFMGIDVHEIVKHKYTCFPARVGDKKPPKADCHPDIQAVYGQDSTIRKGDKLRPYKLAEFPDGFAAQVRGTEPSPGLRNGGRAVTADDRFWGFGVGEAGKPHKVVLHAHWNQSMSDPLDLGATNMRCKVFCHFGCSSFHHNYHVLRFLKGWKRTEDDRFAYWTTAPPIHVNLPSRWIYYVCAYNKNNAFKNWGPSLLYALQQTRGYIQKTGGRYNII